mgnify:CR=1 FL=1
MRDGVRAGWGCGGAHAARRGADEDPAWRKAERDGGSVRRTAEQAAHVGDGAGIEARRFEQGFGFGLGEVGEEVPQQGADQGLDDEPERRTQFPITARKGGVGARRPALRCG